MFMLSRDHKHDRRSGQNSCHRCHYLSAHTLGNRADKHYKQTQSFASPFRTERLLLNLLEFQGLERLLRQAIQWPDGG